MSSENDYGEKPLKKPIPLPRKSLLKLNDNSTKFLQNDVSEKTLKKKLENKNLLNERIIGSENFINGKKKIKSEDNIIEKSVKSIISRGKSYNKSNDNSNSTTISNDSLPDESVFFSISFNSPLNVEDLPLDDYQNNNYDKVNEEEDHLLENLSDDDGLFNTQSLSPPAYPPPELPDESLYDQMKTFNDASESDLQESIFGKSSNCFTLSNHTCFDNNSISNSKSDPIEPDENKVLKKVSTIFYDYDDEDKQNDRYQIIYESPSQNDVKNRYLYLRSILKEDEHDSNDSKVDITSEKTTETNVESNLAGSIICMFDPLQIKNKSKEFAPINSSSMPSKCEFFKEYLPFNSTCEANFPVELITSSIIDNSVISSNMLKEGQYGKINKIGKNSNELLKIYPKNLVAEPPPIPPRPSIYPMPKSNLKNPKIQADKTERQTDTELVKQSDFLINEPCSANHSIEKSKPAENIQWSSLKRVAKKVANNIEHRASYLSLTGKKSSKQIEGDELTEKIKSNCNIGGVSQLPLNFPKHSGIIYRPGGVERWGVLSQRKLTLFANKDSPDIKETILMDNVISVQIAQNKISETIGVHCFEISLSSKNQMLLFGVPSISERHIWMRKLLESIGPCFSARLSMDYSKAGWCYAKESINCDWTKQCILLHHRTLYLSSNYGSVSEFNLRKARSISLKTEGCSSVAPNEKGPQIVIDLQEKTLYLQMYFERETMAWETALMDAALQNGPSLNEQQLTKDDIPTIVDKCLNFIHTHGCFSEGIYRRSGSNRAVNHLLAMFRYNAWSVQLSKDEYTEFDVSSVLKRFFRDLPEPLLTSVIQEELGRIIAVKDIKEKTKEYEMALKKLPSVNYLTARRLMGHLYFIDQQKEKNLMSSENLAAIWGPTILQVQEQVSLDSNCFKIETLVVNDLIRHYPEIFCANEAEIEREIKILQMLKNYHVSNNNTLTKKPSGEIKIWVYLYSANNQDHCYNISVNPQKTAEDVCKELSCKMNEPPHKLCLEEVICGDHLSRPLNHSTKVLETILRWSYWDDMDRKDNCLVLKKNDLFQQVVQYAKYPVVICEELKFADNKSKTFKSCQFEFSQAKLNCYKDKLCSQKIGEWKIEDIIWYFGHEPKRVPHAKWSITFIEKNSIGPRTKERPYFGYTIGGFTEEQKLKLTTAMLMAQYSKNILPIPNLME